MQFLNDLIQWWATPSLPPEMPPKRETQSLTSGAPSKLQDVADFQPPPSNQALALREWLLALNSTDLPFAPFALHPGIIVTDSKGFLTQLQSDARQETSPRNRFGALDADIAALASLLAITSIN